MATEPSLQGPQEWLYVVVVGALALWQASSAPQGPAGQDPRDGLRLRPRPPVTTATTPQPCG